MIELNKLLHDRHSSRLPFDPKRPVPKGDMRLILEAVRWAPTAHNMQNFEIVVVDDPDVLGALGRIEARVSEAFIRENFAQLAASEAELQEKGFGLLGTMFPESWRDKDKLGDAAASALPTHLAQTINGAPAVWVVLYDASKRAPASDGDALGLMSLGCVMQNAWLAAESLGIGFQIMSVFGGGRETEERVKGLLRVPATWKIAYAIRLGYPVTKGVTTLRVRRDVDRFTHHNRFGGGTTS